MTRKENPDLLDIEAAGFIVEIRAGKNGYAKAYIAHKSGFRSLMPVNFKDNKRPTAYLQETMRYARPWHHLGQALEILREERLPFATAEFADWEAMRVIGAIDEAAAEQPKVRARGRL